MKFLSLAACAVLAAALMACSPPAQEAQTSAKAPVRQVSSSARVPAGEVRLDPAIAGTTVSSPLEVRGVAPTTWFYQGTFRGRLIDSAGVTIAEGVFNAQTADDPVPFKGVFTFHVLVETPATLVLNNANPGNRPGYSEEARFPVTLSAAAPAP